MFFTVCLFKVNKTVNFRDQTSNINPLLHFYRDAYPKHIYPFSISFVDIKSPPYTPQACREVSYNTIGEQHCYHKTKKRALTPLFSEKTSSDPAFFVLVSGRVFLCISVQPGYDSAILISTDVRWFLHTPHYFIHRCLR